MAQDKQARSKTLEEAWRIIREVAKTQKATDRQIQKMSEKEEKRWKEEEKQRKEEEKQRKEEEKQRKEEEKQRKEEEKQRKEEEKQRKEEEKQRKEEERQWQEERKKIELEIKEINERMERRHREYVKRSNRLQGFFTDQFGKLIERLMGGNFTKMLKTIGIHVQRAISNVQWEWEGQKGEYDIVADNAKIVVVGEAKTTLRFADIDHFRKRVALYKKIFNQEDKTVYGAMAFLNATPEIIRQAEKKGFIVINVVGEGAATIVNSKKFKPKAF